MKTEELPPNIENALEAGSSLPLGHSSSSIRSGSLTSPSIGLRAVQVILAVMLLFCAAEAITRILVVAYKPAEGTTQYYDRKFHMAKQTPGDNRPAVIFIGASCGAYGIYSDLIAAELRKNGYDINVRNLCTVNTAMSERLLILQTAMRAGAKPLMVVCDIAPLEFSSYWQQHYLPTKENRFASSITGLSYCNRDSSLKSTMTRALADKCYLFTFRSFLQAFLLNCPSLIKHPEKRQDGISFINDKIFCGDQADVPTISSSGWSPNPNVLDERTLDKDGWYGFKFWRNLTGADNPSWFSLATAQPLIDYCAKERIPLVFLWDPWYPPTEKDRKAFAAERLVTYDQLSQMLGKALAAIPNTYLLDFHNADKDVAHFADFLHLNPAGAVYQSERVAHALLSPTYSKFLASGRSLDGRR